MNLRSRIKYKFVNIFLNNILINLFLIIIKKDGFIKKWKNNWGARSFNKTQSLQENVGYSHIPEIQSLVDRSHKILRDFSGKNLHEKSNILDLGCGTGLFIKDIETKHKCFGVDLNETFLDNAKLNFPDSLFIKADYLSFNFDIKFDLIYSFGVLMYFEPSKMADLFRKFAGDLNQGGYILIQYSHAIKINDLFYPDLSYVKYSPQYIEKLVQKDFKIIEHKHSFDDRKVKWYDKKYYYFPNGKNNRTDTVQNSYLLIAQKL